MVTVTVKDSSGASDTEDVTITVTNVAEEPGAPAAPTVVSTDSEDDATTLRVEGDLVSARQHGRGSIETYDVGYKKTTDTSFVTTCQH